MILLLHYRECTGKLAREAVIDSVPEGVRRAAHAVFDRREPGVPVAGILFDSLLEPGGGDLHVRRLEFGGEKLTVVLQVWRDAPALTALVRVSPAEEYDLALRRSGPPIHAVTDQDGCARLSGVGTGLVSLLVTKRGCEKTRVRTAWIQL